MIDLLDMTNEEIIESVSKKIVETNSDPEWKRRLEEYHNNIERDFQEEWAKKHFKWFFTKYRQKKLKSKIFRRYTSPIFLLIEDIIEETLPQVIDDDIWQFVDIKDISLGDKAYFKEDTK